MRTFESPIKISGIGIHSGTPVNMVVKPSSKPGIFFKRVDIKGSGLIPAIYNNVGAATLRNTTVGDVDGAHVQTIEHLMAALFIIGVDSAIIEIDGQETPILDGSAEEFLNAFKGVAVTGASLRRIVVKKEVVVKKKEIMRSLPFFTRMMVIVHDWMLGRRNNGYARLTPDSRGLMIKATFDYPDKIIGRQSFEFFFDGSKKSTNTFVSDIAAARTFGRYSEWEYLKLRGMARGADETNVIALNDKGDGTLNKLKWEDEFVRHQIIDVLGDLFTSGGMIVGQYELYKGGHAMNNLVLKKLFSDPSNYDTID
ncbi:MAG: UDP-3-O-acyl-N-acetylglucosamine deacetylase [Rickettsiales bacterium]|jgi:UDP-3-O-[3-hydroxymyristoyl] N-acetylglucosamine deacetylase|nr:UDP-3-O-acyl-N-acetylglucosamine deacetylase [Rickettsiales bacterium]